jgi:hypothetical protein
VDVVLHAEFAFDPHANARGYRQIARTFEGRLDELLDVAPARAERRPSKARSGLEPLKE